MDVYISVCMARFSKFVSNSSLERFLVMYNVLSMDSKESRQPNIVVVTARAWSGD